MAASLHQKFNAASASFLAIVNQQQRHIMLFGRHYS
jgi:hypothetical protein